MERAMRFRFGQIKAASFTRDWASAQHPLFLGGAVGPSGHRIEQIGRGTIGTVPTGLGTLAGAGLGAVGGEAARRYLGPGDHDIMTSYLPLLGLLGGGAGGNLLGALLAHKLMPEPSWEKKKRHKNQGHGQDQAQDQDQGRDEPAVQ